MDVGDELRGNTLIIVATFYSVPPQVGGSGKRGKNCESPKSLSLELI